ncbi:MAG: T9SS type A sorting domain-containing protein [Candidatus Eisenbacteria bacterium]
MRVSVRGTLVLLLLFAAGHASGDEPRSPREVAPLSLSRIHELDGRPGAPPAGAVRWRQALHEVRLGAGEGSGLPAVSDVRRRGEERARQGVVPIAVLDVRVEREGGEEPVFAAAAMVEHTYRGEDVRFVLDRERYLSAGDGPGRISIDFDDGRGFRMIAPDEPVAVYYGSAGRKTVRLMARSADGLYRHGSFPFVVKALQAPLPDDTLQVTATEPYLGQFGTGEAYVYLSDIHSTLTDPVVVVEGFDLDNTLNWDELYELLNQQNLVEDLRAEGYDAVVLNFTEATDYMQRNAFVITSLLEQVQGMIAPDRDYALAGASMGGLASRYALTWMENQGIPHRARTVLSFDAPHKGANIPLGVQYWVSFFSGLSAEAEYLLSRLDSPAARQLLVYHHTDPPGPSGETDPLRTAFDAELASLGDWPAAPRRVSIVNGSGSGMNQGYGAGAQIVDYEYSSLFIAITGNVWAVPDGGPSTIFDGYIRIIIPTGDLTVTVSGTKPYDNAPGGFRNTMADMDSVTAPYGDIVALHPAHAFIPTVSALALDTEDLFYDIAGDPNLLSMTPFDAVYFPVENQEHVTITPESAEWFLDEIRRDVSTDLAGSAPGRTVLMPNRPNPFNPSTLIRFDLREPSRVTLKVYDAVGREVSTLVSGDRPAGAHEARFDGGNVASGVYFVRLEAGEDRSVRKIVLVR